jgi:hypothetical protein
MSGQGGLARSTFLRCQSKYTQRQGPPLIEPPGPAQLQGPITAGWRRDRRIPLI